MRGTILEYNVAAQTGVITGDDGNRYQFKAAEWKSDRHPETRQNVDFVSAAPGVASEVYLDVTSPQSGGGSLSNGMTKSLIALGCAILAFFIPVIGIILSIAGFILGRQARAAAKAVHDDTAAMVALVAVVISAISLIFAVLGLLALMSIGTGLAIFGMGSSF